VTDKRVDSTPAGRLRGLYEWLTRAAPVQVPSAGAASRLGHDDTPTRVGRYAIERRLGKGGMGVVYAARDDRLERLVALKTMSSLSNDDTARKRFWREARAAASVNHPNVCQIYEIGEDRGELFIAMELLEGEALSEQLRRGPMSVSQTLPIGLGVLAALSALHARGVVHRDLKPSNVFLTPHGVKLLDFGLARPEVAGLQSTATELTGTGMVMGTPRYMAPEQVTGEDVDARADLFATGALLFEMLAGRPAFAGATVLAILHATLNEQPPALTGSPAVAAVDRVIRRALAKRPSDRPPSAAAMAAELHAARGVEGDDTPAVARALTRLVVLPFRVLRPDPETDFLAFSLPDAIATSLSGCGPLIVRSSATAARFVGDAPDFQALASAADVDRVVTGTLLRVGEQLRVTTQLVEAPSGTLLTSQTVQSSLGDLFQLQDDLATRVVEALSLPLVGGFAPPTPGAPPDARAYELYLRANEQARTYAGLAAARALYERCLGLDPGFAPAWAQLGRCHRVLGKFIDGATESEARAEDALRRALELNPRLPVAHKLYANLEADIGSAERAVARLLGEAGRHRHDPELFVGLVHALRYCGLYEESVAAHAEARRLDPHASSSVELTQLMAGELERRLAVDPTPATTDDDQFTRVMSLGLAGRRDQARDLLPDASQVTRIPAFQFRIEFLRAWLDNRPPDMARAWSELSAFKIHDDPEAIFQAGWMLCAVGEHEHGLANIQRAVAKGYCAAATLAGSRAFDTMRSAAAFRAILREAEAGQQHALTGFREAGGEALLGLTGLRSGEAT
jgi:TolB-like protein/tetratricopeptide (TPR) repeat protein/predicted Ser/Thr protein kinase